MRVYVSYSFVDNELHLLTLLFEKLRQEGHVVDWSEIAYNSRKIANADLFIGIVTNHSQSINSVVREWEIAIENNVESILIIENGVEVSNSVTNYIRFDRRNSRKAINELFGVSEKKSIQKKKSNDISPAVIGVGIIAGIAALIALLAGGGDGNKK